MSVDKKNLATAEAAELVPFPVNRLPEGTLRQSRRFNSALHRRFSRKFRELPEDKRPPERLRTLSDIRCMVSIFTRDHYESLVLEDFCISYFRLMFRKYASRATFLHAIVLFFPTMKSIVRVLNAPHQYAKQDNCFDLHFAMEAIDRKVCALMAEMPKKVGSRFDFIMLSFTAGDVGFGWLDALLTHYYQRLVLRPLSQYATDLLAGLPTQLEDASSTVKACSDDEIADILTYELQKQPGGTPPPPQVGVITNFPRTPT